MSPLFDAMYAKCGRPSIPPEKLLRAQLLQMLYSVRSERLLMEEIDYSILFRWFVGLNLDERCGTRPLHQEPGPAAGGGGGQGVSGAGGGAGAGRGI
jgi:transposase